jgi:eukaryotic-like serine/threonine-protein kinase
MVKTLGAGAMGEVYLVQNVASGRYEALKVLKKVEQNSEADLVAQGRFRREVQAAQRLNHQGIVATYDAGQLADGRLYLTMEYVEGVSLHALVQQRGPLPIQLAIGILAEAGDALHHAHAAGVVHRDIKPHNIILADHPNGKIVRILDFGMAKILDTSHKESMVLSADGAIFGTPQYMSPEQCMGKPPDPRTDIYALGCVGFELLLGEPPFRGALAPLFAAHLKTPPRLPSKVDPDAGIPPQLDAVILRCLEKSVDKRFQTGGDLCAALQGVPGYRPLRVPQPRG